MNVVQRMREKKWVVIPLLLISIVIVLGVISLMMNMEKQSQLMNSFPKTTSSSKSQKPQAVKLSESEKLKIATAEQKNADQESVDLKTTTTTKFPWLNRLPLSGDKYYVYFDLQKSSFVATVYLSPGDTVDQIKEQVMRDLQEKKQIPVQKYSFEWIVYEKK